jgi:galactokinase
MHQHPVPTCAQDSHQQRQRSSDDDTGDGRRRRRRSSNFFDERLRDKLLFRRQQHEHPSDDDDDDGGDSSTTPHNTVTNSANISDDHTTTFHTVRTLFRNATNALESELRHQRSLHRCTNSGSSCSRNNNIHDDDAPVTTTIQTNNRHHCHWIPGRIEVMGKHTDYAGGNSLVCATARRGMAMVSTFIGTDDSKDDEELIAKTTATLTSITVNTAKGNCESDSKSNHDNDNARTMKVTIVSVLPQGMNHHATSTTTAPYDVEGRTVVHHTIILSDKSQVQDDEDECDATTRPNDWTIYPTAVIQRLHHNFGLYPNCGTVSGDGDGGHLLIAISSNLPPASGLSTSSALVTGLFLAVNSHIQLSSSDRFRSAIGDVDDKDTIYNLSTYLGNIENGRDYIYNNVVLEGTIHGGVGTFGGSEDHAAILLGKIGEFRLLSFCPTRPTTIDMMPVNSDSMMDENENVPLYPIVGTIDSVVRLPADVTFVIAYSGIKAEKAGSADGSSVASVGYNSASELARFGLMAYIAGGSGEDRKERFDNIITLADAIRWERKRKPSASFLDIRCEISKRIMAGASLSDDRGDEYSNSLVQRFVHFYNESEYLVPAAAYALSHKKYDLLGAVVDASHRGAVNLLNNQTVETAWLPLWARGKENTLQMNPLHVVDTDYITCEANNGPRIKALAASAFGAGYGGSCWALVYRHESHAFVQQWQTAYEEKFPASEQCIDFVREFFVTDPGPGAFRV